MKTQDGRNEILGIQKHLISSGPGRIIFAPIIFDKNEYFSKLNVLAETKQNIPLKSNC